MDFREFNEFIKDTFSYILVIIIVLILFIFVVSFQGVSGDSMYPNFKEKEAIVVSKISKYFNYKRFDVITFDYYSKDNELISKNFIKRIIGLPGEYIEYKDNVLYVDGIQYEEEFLKDVITKNFSLKDLGYDKIPDDYYLVLGDNREVALDSRKMGLITKKEITGKVVAIIWPINEFKLY